MRLTMLLVSMMFITGCAGVDFNKIREEARGVIGSAGEGRYEAIVTKDGKEIYKKVMDCEKDTTKVGGMECRVR